ncbi:hypothetical protein V8F33_009632 [Rhypophila sp. PSN 637]
MASIISLGVHQPTGLQYAIQESILPKNPPSSSYTWEIYTDGIDNNGCVVEDELLTTDTCVIWSRGGIFRKSFKFNLEKETITQSLLTYFPASSDRQETTEQADRTDRDTKCEPLLSRALVVFLKTHAQVYFLSGTSHVVHMPFEVESACPAPCGVIIQRKAKTNTNSSMALRLPKVPPNSFVSSMPSPDDLRSQKGPEFSIESLGHPKILPLRLSSTLENMWQPWMETSESHWPRLVCLTDPLLEIGLVVTHPDRPKASSRRRSSVASLFLDPAEEILHVEAIKLPGSLARSDVNLAVTINRETSMYSIWRMAFLETEDIFIGKKKDRKKSPAGRRRSSMAPGGIPSGAATPVHPSMRESFGAPLPGKKPRKSVKIEEKDKALEDALSSLDPDKGGDAARRQSRRVSSLLARADLSASQDRTSFTETAYHPVNGGKRADSHGSQRGRISSGLGGPSFSAGANLNYGLNSLAEAPVDSLLEELRAGGDFEGFGTMGLDDHDFEGLTREMLFTKIHSIPMDNVNVRYSLSNQPARTQAKVFILVGPATVTDELGRTQLLVGIQDPLDKRLQILTLYAEKSEEQTRSSSWPRVNIVFGELRRAQSVVDSCKVSDKGVETIFILSEDKSSGRELSLQSPWSKLTTVHLPMLFIDNLDSLDYIGSHRVNREVRGRRSIGIGMTGSHINSVSHPMHNGVVDLLDKDGRFHRIQIKLQPSSQQVRKGLEACRSVLPASSADMMLGGWWHVMHWLEGVKSQGLPSPPVDAEWSSFVILILSSFIALNHRDQAALQAIADGVAWPSAMNKWETMQVHESANSSDSPTWMRSKAWEWLPDVDAPLKKASTGSNVRSEDFMVRHTRLAIRFMASAEGLSAFGEQGYLPSAMVSDYDSRKRAAWSMFMALHLLTEEQKLTIMLPEDGASGQGDLIALLRQITCWLGWAKYTALYDLTSPAPLAVSAQNPIVLVEACIDEPAENTCVLTWIQAHINNHAGHDFLTLPHVFSAATGESLKDNPRTDLWESLTPRTFMFKKLFGQLKSTRNHVEIVVAMHNCGFTPQMLETLPEAVMTPLQDLIFLCQNNPPPSWPKSLLSLVNRTDICGILQPNKVWRGAGAETHVPPHVARWDFRMLCQHLDSFHEQLEDTDATERQAVVRALFKEDRRLNEAQNLLSTTKPRVLRLEHHIDWTEAEYLEKQKELVTTVATGTLAIPAGRGLLYYGLRNPLLTQKYHIAGFNLTCYVKPNNNTVSVDKSLFTEEKINWAFFHQGVAGGLAISPDAKGIDTSWILYNKPGQDLSNRHAGFLLALGLHGHLKSVAKWVAFKYLTPKHTMTSIGLLLGLAASYLGTMDSLITRLLSVHVTRMLPVGAAELNLSKHTQTTGIMGIGLVYANSQHRRMSEIMMSEIEHLDDIDEEDPLRDEGYRLAAGFALGFINLGRGNDLKGLQDMRLTEKLLSIATSTKRVELVHVLDRSAAAAVVAVALIFMKTEDQIVARKIDVPSSVVQFDYVRPDILLLRTMARHVILWSGIEASFEWIRDNLPDEYRPRARLTDSDVNALRSKDMPFFSILAGLCWSLGLRFAGSGDEEVRDLLVGYLDSFMRIVNMGKGKGRGTFDAELARGNARMCMDLLGLSCAMVMAGSGDLVVLRRLRALHGRDDKETSYGSHLAAHLSIGALFLGCGTATFGTGNLAVAAMIVAFYPIFPGGVQDCGSHLQAFRHFWVLAVERRCLVGRDLATGGVVNVPVEVRLQQGEKVVAVRKQTPCLLPPLEEILTVKTDARDLGFWDLEVDFAGDKRLVESFKRNQSLFLRRRPALERTFPGTLAALGGERVGMGTEQLGRDPLEWVFNLDALRGLTHAERDMVLDWVGSGAGIGEGEGASNAVDARLVLRAGLDFASRDRVLGLRLLFEWADRRGSLLQQSRERDQPLGGVAGKKDEDVAAGKKEKGKGKAVSTPAPVATSATSASGRTTRRKKQVSVETPPVSPVKRSRRAAAGSSRTVDHSSSSATVGRETRDTMAPQQGQVREGEGSEDRGSLWWLRDSVVDELKGEAWLAGRE